MGKALNYMLKLWPGLTVFLDNPEVPLDNNAAERALRGVVVGRKNHYGSIGSTYRKETVPMGTTGGTPAATIRMPEKNCQE